MQRRDHELNGLRGDLLNQPMETLIVKVRCWVIQQQRRACPSIRRVKTYLRQEQCGCDELLLSPGNVISRARAVHRNSQVCALWTYLSESTLLVHC